MKRERLAVFEDFERVDENDTPCSQPQQQPARDVGLVRSKTAPSKTLQVSSAELFARAPLAPLQNQNGGSAVTQQQQQQQAVPVSSVSSASAGDDFTQLLLVQLGIVHEDGKHRLTDVQKQQRVAQLLNAEEQLPVLQHRLQEAEQKAARLTQQLVRETSEHLT